MAVESTILATVCIYAAINALLGLTSGGHSVSYGFGLIWATVICIPPIAMAGYMSRLARQQGSTLLAVDARG